MINDDVRRAVTEYVGRTSAGDIVFASNAVSEALAQGAPIEAAVRLAVVAFLLEDNHLERLLEAVRFAENLPPDRSRLKFSIHTAKP